MISVRPGPRLRKLCGELGLEYRGVWPLVMPENYVAMFPVPGEEEAKKIIDAAREPLLEATALIAGDQPFPGGKLTLADRLKSGIVNRFFYRFCIKSSPFYTTPACNGCGRCSQNVLHQLHRDAGGQTPLGGALYPLHGLYLRLPAARH